MSTVHRLGDTVRRITRPPNPIATPLLTFLAEKGFKGSPRFLGIDDKGRDVLSYIHGEVPKELGHYDDGQLTVAADLMRSFHDVTSQFPDRAGCEIICHNDWSPPNCVFHDALPVAMIDFDTLAPGFRLWDLGYTAHTFLNLGSANYGVAEQLRRLRIFAHAYGLEESRLPELAVHISARLSSLARWAQDIDSRDITEWAEKSRDWVVTHILDSLLPSLRGRVASIREPAVP